MIRQLGVSPPERTEMRAMDGGLRYRVLRVCVRALLRVGWGLRVEGLERLPKPPYIIAPNHTSEIDPVVLSAVLPFRPTYLAARYLERFPVLFAILRRFDPVFVRRGLSDIGSIKACLQRLARGEILVVFPEGRVVQQEELGPMHPGAAFLAIRAGVPLIPVALIGLAQMWPLGARWPRRSRIAVQIGDPIARPAGDGEQAAVVTEAIARAIRRLMGRQND